MQTLAVAGTQPSEVDTRLFVAPPRPGLLVYVSGVYQEERFVTTTIAKLFKNGRSQAVRLRREFRFEFDVLLAGQARRHGATLVTSNSKEFARVSALRWEHWAATRR
jgi:hypothetical protein